MQVNPQTLRVDGPREPEQVATTTTTRARPEVVGIAAPDARFTGPVTGPGEATPIPREALADLAGRSAFLRVIRHDGQTEVLAGRIDAVENDTLLIGEFDVDVARK